MAKTKNRARIIIGNWKMNPRSLKEADKLSKTIAKSVSGIKKTEVVICPPFLYLEKLKKNSRKVLLGAQDSFWGDVGAFTGQVSGEMLYDIGVRYAIVGHSERRLLGEDDKLLNRKVQQAIARSFEPILCVGYGSAKNSSLATVKKIIKKQLQVDLKGVNVKKHKITIAYEPLWVIGTGKPASPGHCAEVKEFIADIAPNTRIIYGGSLDGKNAKDYAVAGLEGGLVGGASLKADEFLGVVKAFSS